jgi:hypothetical protein
VIGHREAALHVLLDHEDGDAAVGHRTQRDEHAPAIPVEAVDPLARGLHGVDPGVSLEPVVVGLVLVLPLELLREREDGRHGGVDHEADVPADPVGRLAGAA